MGNLDYRNFQNIFEKVLTMGFGYGIMVLQAGDTR